MFNDKYRLTQAVLEGRKTQTRRIAYNGEVPNLIKGYGYEGLFVAVPLYSMASI